MDTTGTEKLMADNLKEFNADLSKFGEAVEKAPGVVVRKLALDILKRVRETTPVITGRAKANWFPTVGKPSSEIDYEATNKAPLGSAGGGKTFPAQIPNFPVLWITNNLPYINELNDGSSTQAPKNFVELAVEQEVKAIL